jgi:hypothetical protein
MANSDENLTEIDFKIYTDKEGNPVYGFGWARDIIVSKIEIDPKTGKTSIKEETPKKIII